MPGEDLLGRRRRSVLSVDDERVRKRRRTVSSSTSGTPALLTHCATARSNTFICVLSFLTNAAGPCLVMSLYACVAS